MSERGAYSQNYGAVWRRRKYATDPAYRARALARSAKIKKARKAEKAGGAR